MYSKSPHGRDWLGVDINSGMSAQSAGRDAQTASRPTAASYFYVSFTANSKLSTPIKTFYYHRNCRKSPKGQILINSHIIKSISYVLQICMFGFFDSLISKRNNELPRSKLRGI